MNIQPSKLWEESSDYLTFLPKNLPPLGDDDDLLLMHRITSPGLPVEDERSVKEGLKIEVEEVREVGKILKLDNGQHSNVSGHDILSSLESANERIGLAVAASKEGIHLEKPKFLTVAMQKKTALGLETTEGVIEVSNVVLQAVTLGVEGHHYAELEHKANELIVKLEEMRKENDIHPSRTLANEIEFNINVLNHVRNQQAAIRTELINSSMKTVAGVVKASGVVAKNVSELIPAVEHAHGPLLNTVSVGTNAVAGLGSLIISTKLLIDNMAVDSAIRKEIIQLSLLKDKTESPLLKQIIDLRILNLVHQDKGNVIKVIQNAISFSGGSLGLTSGIIACVGSGGLVAVIGSTAGTGALVMGGLAAGVGVSYLVWENKDRPYYASYYTLLDLQSKLLVSRIKSLESTISESMQKIVDLQNQSIQRSEKGFEQKNKKLIERITKITEEISKLEWELNATLDPVKQDGLWEKINSKMTKKAKLLVKQSQSVSVKMSGNIQFNPEGIGKLTHSINSSNEEIARQKNNLVQLRKKMKELEDEAKDTRMSSQCANTSIEDVTHFRQSVIRGLQSDSFKEEAKEFLIKVHSPMLQKFHEDPVEAILQYVVTPCTV